MPSASTVSSPAGDARDGVPAEAAEEEVADATETEALDSGRAAEAATVSRHDREEGETAMTEMTTLKQKHVRAERRALTPSGQPRARISTNQVDSQRDVVHQDGLTFRSPMRVLLAHDAAALPVGVVSAIHRAPDHTEAEWTWIENDPVVARVRNCYEQNGLDCSIGMMVEEAVPNAHGGFDIHKAHVVEFSLTAVPANPGALALAKSLATRGSALPSGDEIVLTLRDDEPGHVGQNRCPGPYGTGGCPHVPLQAVENCPAAADRRCPMRGENLQSSFSGIVVHDAAPSIGSDVELAALVARTVRDVVEEQVTKASGEWTTKLTGKID
jgi:hypothetical protein